ncbi:MAG: rRNA pseudouridine synthase [Betaproteobacteria bacterium]|nr:rRNA pseudouridine synthase [Betaproteobacteria bacterium]
MIKRIVVTTGLKARGYVDGRYVGEDKKDPERTDVLGRGKRRGKSGAGAGAGAKGRGKKRGAGAGQADNIGNTVGGKRGRRGQQGKGQGQGQGQGRGQGRRGSVANADGVLANAIGPVAGGRGQPRGQQRKSRSGGKKTPFRPPMGNQHGMASPSEAAQLRRSGEEAKSGQFAEALAAQANVKRERLHKVMAQSGIGSRRDMEIMIAGGRVMVNGIVATTGTQVSPGDNVMVDHRPVKLKFNEDLPRVLLYHKPEGEIVTTDDPGNRITVFDNLPRVENGKWIAIGRLDINTSGLLIFTTSGELANRFMHPRYEVEREYAVRILGELNDDQTQALLSGVNIDFDRDEDEGDGEDNPVVPAKFDTIEKRGGEGVNQWYHVTIREGRNREVRKMFESQGLTVSRLIRIRFGKIELPQRLVRGKMVELTPEQVRSVLVAAGLAEEFGASGPRAPLPSRQRGEGGQQQGRQGQPGQGKSRRGPPKRVAEEGAAISSDANGEMPAPGNEQEAGERPPRARRNRRGGKGRRQNAGAVTGGNGQQPADNAGNQTEAGGNVAVASEASGSGADGNAGQPGKAPGRNNRNRQRRNFRGRNNRNRPRDGNTAEGGEKNGNVATGSGGNTGGENSGGGDREGNF